MLGLLGSQHAAPTRLDRSPATSEPTSEAVSCADKQDLLTLPCAVRALDLRE